MNRREFFKTCMGGMAGIVAAPLLAQADPRDELVKLVTSSGLKVTGAPAIVILPLECPAGWVKTQKHIEAMQAELPRGWKVYRMT